MIKIERMARQLLHRSPRSRLPLALLPLLLLIANKAAFASPAPASCENWARNGECNRNPGFMWAECAAACKGQGLKEPWADTDAKALAGPPAGAQVLELSFAQSTGYSPLRIALRPDLAPQTVAAVVKSIGELGHEAAAAIFYRNEAVPAAPAGQCGDILCGPYSLIQGRLAALAGTPAEAMPIVRKGFVARIQQGHDFFIALDDHAEWGHTFTVWGELDDAAGMATLELISKLPYHEQKAAGAETVMRLLDVELEARGAIVEASSSSGSSSSSSGSSSSSSSGSSSSSSRGGDAVATATLNTEL